MVIMSQVLTSHKWHRIQPCKSKTRPINPRLIVLISWLHLNRSKVWMQTFHCSAIVVISVNETREDTVTAALHLCIELLLDTIRVSWVLPRLCWGCSIIGLSRCITSATSDLEGLALCTQLWSHTCWVRSLVALVVRLLLLWIFVSRGCLNLRLWIVAFIVSCWYIAVALISLCLDWRGQQSLVLVIGVHSRCWLVWIISTLWPSRQWFIAGWVLETQVAGGGWRQLLSHGIKRQKLTLVVRVCIWLVTCVAAQRFVMARAEASSENGVIRVAHYALLQDIRQG